VSSEQALATWQSEPCPSWCARVHHDDDHPDDRYHDSTQLQVPSILMERDLDAGPGQWVSVPEDLTIVSSRYDSADDIITFIGRADRHDQHLQLSPETARRLAQSILDHLDQLDTGH
jgi:hypothetical protein